MSITEKELVQKLRGEFGDVGGTFEEVARRAAELLGHEFAPEKPEPGTWHIVKDGEFYGCPAYVEPHGELRIIRDGFNVGSYTPNFPDWPDLTPARVVPAEPVELPADACRTAWDAIEPWCEGSPRYMSSWDGLPTADQSDLAMFAHNLLAKHGGARELPGREEETSVARWLCGKCQRDDIPMHHRSCPKGGTEGGGDRG